MIKFFRKIRQNLLSEGKTEKYFKYAIGNNLNEQRKAYKQELLLLKQLQIDINSNFNEVIELNKRLIINKKGIDSLSARLNKKHYDIMVPIFVSEALRKSDFNYSSSGYNLMQNGKASLISNEAVLKSILSLYENDFPNIITRQNEMKNSIDILQRNFINKLFVKSDNDFKVKLNQYDEVATDLFTPIDFNSLTENIELKNILIQLGMLVEIRLAYLKKTEDNLNRATTLLNLNYNLE